MTYTPNLNLKKPDSTDFVKISDINDNSDAIDAAIGDIETALAALIGDES